MNATRLPTLHKITAWILCALLVSSNGNAFASTSHATKDNGQLSLQVSIPETLGRIDESFRGSSDKTVIYIQDAHDSLEAQKNISKIIGHLVEHHGVKTVYEEGYEGPVPTDQYFSFVKNQKLKEKIAYFLMDKLRLGGAEYAHVARKKDFKLIGADSIRLHLENIKQYQESAKHKTETEKDLEAIASEIKRLADQYFPKELKEWMRLKERFDDGRLDVLTYLKRITALTPSLSIPQQIRLLLQASEGKDEQTNQAVKELDPKILFREIDLLENAFADHHLKNEQGRKIFQHYKSIELLERLSDIRLSSAEYEVIKNSVQTLKAETFARFIVEATGRSIVLPKRWEQNIRNAIRFYEIAEARDRLVEQNLESFIASPDEKLTVMVFGGFHKSKLQEILKSKRISCLTVSPKITSISDVHQQYYRELMSVGRLSFEPSAYVRIAAPTARALEVIANPSSYLLGLPNKVFSPDLKVAIRSEMRSESVQNERIGIEKSLFVDPREKKARTLTAEEDRALNDALTAVAFSNLEEGGSEFLTDEKTRRLLGYASEQFSDRHITPEIRVIDDSVLRRFLVPEFHYLADGWITHAGTWRGDPLAEQHANVFVPRSIYDRLVEYYEHYREHSWLTFWRSNVVTALLGEEAEAFSERDRFGHAYALYRDRLEKAEEKKKEQEGWADYHRRRGEEAKAEEKQNDQNASVGYGFHQYTEAFELKRLFASMGATDEAVQQLEHRLSQPFRRKDDVLRQYAIQQDLASKPEVLQTLMETFREIESLTQGVLDERHFEQESQETYDAQTRKFRETLLPETGKLHIMLKKLAGILVPYKNPEAVQLKQYVDEILERYASTFPADSDMFKKHEFRYDFMGHGLYSNAPKLGYGAKDVLQNLLKRPGEVAASATLATLRVQRGYKEVIFTSGGALFGMTNARHPVLKIKGEFQPVAFEIPALGKAILISGLNTGGKSVTLKTAGLIALMVQCGIPVPADVEMDEVMFAGFVKPDIRSHNVEIGEASRFAAELGTSGELIETLPPRTFAIIDDDMFGGASEPAVEASGFAATVESLTERKVSVIAVTHHIDALEALRERHPDYVFKRIKTKPGADGADETTYSMEDGIAGSSQGLHETVRQNWPAADRAVVYYNMLRSKRAETQISFQGLRAPNRGKPAKYRGFFYSNAERSNLETWQYGNIVYAVGLATLGDQGAYEAKEFVDHIMKKPESLDARLWQESIRALRASPKLLRELEVRLRENMQEWERSTMPVRNIYDFSDRKPPIKKDAPVVKTFTDLVTFAEKSGIPILQEYAKDIRAFLEDKSKSYGFMRELSDEGLAHALAMTRDSERSKAVGHSIRALFAISALARFSWPFADQKAERGLIDIEGGWHSTLSGNPKRIANDIHIKPNGNAGSLSIYTGFNTGGKSTLAKMIAQIVTLAKMGWPVPAKSATIGEFTDIQVGSGTLTEEKQRDHSRKHKSAIGGALAAALHESGLVIQSATSKTLVVLDEPFSGATEPSVSAALTAALAEELTKRGSTVILITHLLESVPLLTERIPYAETFKAKTREQDGLTLPLYSFEPGVALSSHGFDVAKQMRWPGLKQALAFFGLLTKQAQGIQTSERIRSEMRINTSANAIRENYVVSIDTSVFNTLSDAQRSEFYKLFTARSEVRFVFNMTTETKQTPILDELQGFDQRLQNVEIRMSPSMLGFPGRKVISVTKEGVQSNLDQALEAQLRRSKDFYPVRYPKTANEPGLLTAALLLLDAGKDDLIRQRQYFSEVPAALRSEIRQFLESYIYIARSA